MSCDNYRYITIDLCWIESMPWIQNYMMPSSHKHCLSSRTCHRHPMSWFGWQLLVTKFNHFNCQSVTQNSVEHITFFPASAFQLDSFNCFQTATDEQSRWNDTFHDGCWSTRKNGEGRGGKGGGLNRQENSLRVTSFGADVSFFNLCLLKTCV